MAASLDHSMWFHRPFRVDDWLLYSIESPSRPWRPRVRQGHLPYPRRRAGRIGGPGGTAAHGHQAPCLAATERTKSKPNMTFVNGSSLHCDHVSECGWPACSRRSNAARASCPRNAQPCVIVSSPPFPSPSTWRPYGSTRSCGGRVPSAPAFPTPSSDEARALPGAWHLLALSEDWCGDAVNILPVVARLADALPNVELRVLARDENLDIMDAHLTGRPQPFDPGVHPLRRRLPANAAGGVRGPAGSRSGSWRRGMKMEPGPRYAETRRFYARDKGNGDPRRGARPDSFRRDRPRNPVTRPMNRSLRHLAPALLCAAALLTVPPSPPQRPGARLPPRAPLRHPARAGPHPAGVARRSGSRRTSPC